MQRFIVKLFGEVQDPDLDDSVIISINVGDKLGNEIDNVRDFLRLNPECLELNELVLQATEFLIQGDRNKAQSLLDNTLDRCKFLLSTKNLNLEEPGSIKKYAKVFRNPYFKIALAAVLIGALITLSYMSYNRYKWS